MSVTLARSRRSEMRWQGFYERIARLLKERESFAVAEITAHRGSTPQNPGAAFIVFPDGSYEFTIGGGPFEAAVITDVTRGFHPAKPFTKTYSLSPETLGMYCAGEAVVTVRYFKPDPRLIIFGGGHIGQALSAIAGTLRLFEVVVVDDRPEYANQFRHPSADMVMLAGPNYAGDLPKADARTFVVIVTRCHESDYRLLRYYLDKPTAYLGMVGSKTKWARFKRQLRAEGASPEQIERVRSPIGLPIGGKSPHEVAVSILAEVIKVKNETF
ncbi:MAG: XdhC family protein [bacterium JZ-2024 1]